jgi:hypothetical protein
VEPPVFHVLNATAQSGNRPGYLIKKRPFPASLLTIGLFFRSSDRDPLEGTSAREFQTCYCDNPGKALKYYEHLLTPEL